MSPEVISKVVRDYFSAVRAMDQQAWVNTFATDAFSYDPVGGPKIEGHADLATFFQSIVGEFKEIGLTADQVFIAGNCAAVKWTGRGVSKQGNKVHFGGIDVFEVNEQGKIQNLHAYWNPAEMMAQL